MNPLLFVVLVIVLLVMGSKLSALRKRVEQLEQSLAKLLGERRQVSGPMPSAPPDSPSSAPPPPPVTPASVPALAREMEAPRPVQATAAAPAAPSRAARPASSPGNPWDEVPLKWIRAYFTGGNVVVRVGIIVLFFGVGFFLKYAVERAQLSMQVRLAAAAFGALVLFVLGWRLRHRRRGFSLALQGGAVGILYLILYAALHLYQLIDPRIAFALMAALGIASLILANSQGSLAFALLGAIGGYLAPLLASTGSGNHVVLFGYYALLTLGVVAQAWFRAWRPLNLLAFLFVFGVGTAWGILRYEPALYASTQPFLVFFFLAFIAIAVLFALRQAPRLAHYVDGTLVFGTPLIAMSLQLQLVRDLPDGRPISALLASLAYLAIAAWLYASRRETLRLLFESFLAIGVALFTLAVPLALDDSWTSVAWALEGAGLYWAGARQQRALARAAGALLQLVAGIFFIRQVAGIPSSVPIANAACIGALLLAVAGLLSARIAMRYGTQQRELDRVAGESFSDPFLAWGLGWWLYAWGHEMQRFLPDRILPGALLGLLALTALAAALFSRQLKWPRLRVPACLIVPVMLLAAVWWLREAGHPGSEGGWLGWPLAFLAAGLVLQWHQSSLPVRLAAAMHVVLLWLACLLASGEGSWWVGELAGQGSAWARAAWAVIPAAVLVLLAGHVETVRAWRAFPDALRFRAATGIAAALALWLAWVNLRSDGAAAPLPYLPLLNPLDLACGLVVWSIGHWLRVAWRTGPIPSELLRWMTGTLVLLAFGWLNGVLLRTMHHWRGVPWRLQALLDDTAVQAALSIFWTVLALGAMLWANRSRQRLVWFAAAGLMAVVVAKLFLVDLASIGTIARIVSFLGVGGLMLVIGYYSPLPPAAKAAPAN